MLVTFLLLAAINAYIAGGLLGQIIVPENFEPIWRVWIRFVFYLSMSIYFLLAIKAASVVVQ
jgi:hypothetical protein